MNTKRPVAIPLLAGIHYPLQALIVFSICTVTFAQQAIKTGPEVGSTLPSFEAADQNGRTQNLQSILGPKGALLVFYRSADW